VNGGQDSILSTDLQIVRVLDDKLKRRHPDGVSLMHTIEGGKVLELHRQIRQSFNPNACAKSTELTDYLWRVGRVCTLEPGGGITVRGSTQDEIYNVGRKLFREAVEEYRLIRMMLVEVI
jgi:hypothetical protein